MIIDNMIFSLAGIHRQTSKNSPSPEMISDTIKLFSKASSDIQIVSGGFSPKSYCNEGVVSVLDKAIKKKCSVEVIVGPDANNGCLHTWASLGVPVYVLNKRPNRHFAVVDGKHVRVEDPHKPGHEKEVQYVIYNFKDAGKLVNIFEELKKQAKPLENK